MTRSLCCSTATHFLHGISKGTHSWYIWHIPYICVTLWCCTTTQSQVLCPCWFVPGICNIDVCPQVSSLCWWSTLEGHHPCFPIVCTFRFDTQIWSTSRWVLHTALNSGWTNISINRCIMHLCFCNIISSTMPPLYIIHFTINQNLLALMSSLDWVLPNMYYEIGICWCHMENILVAL